MKLPARLLRPRWIWPGIGLLSLSAALWGGHAAHRRLLDDQVQSAVRFASVLTPADIPAAGLKTRLTRLARVSPEIRTVFLARFVPATGQAAFVADSLPAGYVGSHRAGDAVADPRQLAGLGQAVRVGSAASEPIRDGAGTSLVAYAAVDTADPSGTVPVLGVESSCPSWSAAWWRMALPSALAVWAVLGLPFAARQVRERDAERREALRNLSEAVEQSQSAIVIVNLSDRVEYANHGVCQQLGYDRRELIGRSWRGLHDPDTSPDIHADIAASIRAGCSWTGEWVSRRKNGERYAVRGQVSPVKNRHGRLLSYVAVFQDLTEIRRSEAAMRSALERAEAGDRAKNRFFATMNHEVRTPLNGIVGFTSLLAEANLPADAREYVDTIRSSAEALIRLTGDILDYARIETGGLELEPAPCDLRALVNDTVERLATAVAEKPLQLLRTIDPAVPPSVVVDASRLRQVLDSLVSNAVKFTREGFVELTLGAGPVEGGRVRINFSVRDTGIGIAPRDRALLFRPFSQIDAGSTRTYGGSGLGLAIARNLVRLMGGDIALESAPGRGSTFRFSILVATPAEPVEPAAPPAAADAGPAVKAYGLNVLVVEDNEVNQRLVQRLLASLGCRWTMADNGWRGLEALRGAAEPYDMVLMDLHMPELDGLETIVRIRSGEAGAAARRVWITVLTADARPDQKERALAAGANDFLVKPVGLPDLAEGLRRFSLVAPAAPVAPATPATPAAPAIG